MLPVAEITLIGLRLASIILFASAILAWLQSDKSLTEVGKYRGLSWLFISIGIGVFSGPRTVADSYGGHISHELNLILGYGGILFVLTGAIFHQAARTLTNGGRMKDVKKTMWSNVIVILLSVLTVWVSALK